MSDDYLQKINDKIEHGVRVLNKLQDDQKFSKFAREIYNQTGLEGKVTKAEDMLNKVYEIAMSSEKDEDKIKAIKVFAEMVGGGLNEKQTNIQNNISGNFFLDMLSNKK